MKDKKIYLVTIEGAWSVEIVKITFNEKDAIITANNTLKNETDNYNTVRVKQYTLDVILYDNIRDIFKDSKRNNHCKIIYEKQKDNK